MIGLELTLLMFGLVAFTSGALALTVALTERSKRAFVRRVALAIDDVRDVDSGDVERPLSFVVGSTRVRAVMRGRVPVWQLERQVTAAAAPLLVVVERGWRAPGLEAMAPVSPLTPRLLAYGADAAASSSWLLHARAELVRALGPVSHRCEMGPGRVFLEVARRGLDVDELRLAMVRLGAVADVADGRPALLLPPSAGRAVAGPAGFPVPALS